MLLIPDKDADPVPDAGLVPNASEQSLNEGARKAGSQNDSSSLDNQDNRSPKRPNEDINSNPKKKVHISHAIIIIISLV